MSYLYDKSALGQIIDVAKYETSHYLNQNNQIFKTVLLSQSFLIHHYKSDGRIQDTWQIS